jgi:hypothetical protein
MIKGIYEGYDYLNIIDAYRNIAWESIGSGYSQDDPCVNSLSNFIRICNENNIQVKYLEEWKNEGFKINCFNYNKLPLIFIISAYSKNIESILECVENGANLLYIDSMPVYITNSNFDEEKTSTINAIFQALNIKTLNYCKHPYGKGNVFIIKQDKINDLEIESGPFGKVSKNITEQKIEAIREIVNSISLFNLPSISAKIDSQAITHPVNETFFFEIDIKNNSISNLTNLNFQIHYPDSIYPTSNIEIYQSIIPSNTSFKIRQFCIPIVEGKIKSHISISVRSKENFERKIQIPFKLNVLENYKDLVTKSIPKQLNMLSYLDDFQDFFKPPFNSKKFKDLLETDPETLVIKIRKIAESLVKRISRNKIKNYSPNSSFSSSIFELHKYKIIDNKMNGFINTVRIFGNMAAHSNPDGNTNFNEKDAFSIANAFISFVSDCVDKNLI